MYFIWQWALAGGCSRDGNSSLHARRNGWKRAGGRSAKSRRPVPVARRNCFRTAIIPVDVLTYTLFLRSPSFPLYLRLLRRWVRVSGFHGLRRPTTTTTTTTTTTFNIRTPDSKASFPGAEQQQPPLFNHVQPKVAFPPARQLFIRSKINPRRVKVATLS